MKSATMFKKFVAMLLAAVTVMLGMQFAALAEDTITVVWYPNESAADYEGARQAFGELIEQATGKKVEHKLTTDYSIAIEAIASGTAQISFMGAQGYIEANAKNPAVLPLFVNSGASGTLDDAKYYSWIAVNKGDEDAYKVDGAYALAALEGKRMSFVSASSTSGFKSAYQRQSFPSSRVPKSGARSLRMT